MRDLGSAASKNASQRAIAVPATSLSFRTVGPPANLRVVERREAVGHSFVRARAQLVLQRGNVARTAPRLVDVDGRLDRHSPALLDQT